MAKSNFPKDELTMEQKNLFSKMMEHHLKPYGFNKVTREFGGSVKYSRSIRFERLPSESTGEYINCIFDKYGRPKVKLTFGVHDFEKDRFVVRYGALIKNRRQVFYEWGAKWYSISRKSAWQKQTSKIPKFIPHIVEFLELGKAGRNICDKDASQVIYFDSAKVDKT